jgi:diguanylate cyclase (GGDEF)-like protein/PAS domain S-box-containing protein
MNFGFAYHKLICGNDGRLSDFEFIEANENFKVIFGTGSDDIKGKRASVIFPDIHCNKTDLLAEFCDIALNGGNKQILVYSSNSKKWVRINVFSSEKYYFATVSCLIGDMPFGEDKEITLENIIETEKLQFFQDLFAEALEIGSVITRPDGSMITRPSNCSGAGNEVDCTTDNVYRGSVGSENIEAMQNSEVLRLNRPEPEPGLSGARINVGDRHVANWIICDSKTSKADLEKLASLQPETFPDGNMIKKPVKAAATPADKADKFDKIVRLLYISANELSETAYQNIIQARLIENLKFAEQRAYTENEQLKITLMSIGEAVITTDEAGVIMQMNKTAEQLTGFTFIEARGKEIGGIFDIVSSGSDDDGENPVSRLLNQSTVERMEGGSTLLSKDGVLREVSYTVSTLRDKDGHIEGTVIIFRDITQDKLKQKEIVYLSYHDMLTGLYNRRYLEQMLEEFDKEEYLPLYIVMGDVNSLKLTNDVFGHLEGDKILRHTSSILKKHCSKRDVLARWGGDEFVILMPNCTEQHVESVCKSIYNECSSSEDFKIRASISLGFAPRKSMNENPLDVLKHAELYMYYQKTEEHEHFDNEFIGSLKESMYKSSPITNGQIQQIKELSLKTGEFLQLSERDLQKLGLLAEMHDIGNIAVDNKLLNKPDYLDEEEWKNVKRHPEIGYRISQITKDLSDISELILLHHEQWDGGGYPSGLRGKKTPLLSRILAVADSYVAMTSDRPQRRAMTKEKAIEELRALAGKKYDALVVDVFINKVLNT